MVLSPNYSYPGVPQESSRGGTFLLVVLFVVLCESQNVFGDGLAIAGSRPDFLLAAVVACGIFRGREQGFWLGLTGGLIQDIASSASGPLGQLALAKLLIGWLAGCLATSVRRSFILVPIIVIAVATVVNRLCVVFFSGALAGLDGAAMASVVLANMLYGVPLYYLISYVPGGIRS